MLNFLPVWLRQTWPFGDVAHRQHIAWLVYVLLPCIQILTSAVGRSEARLRQVFAEATAFASAPRRDGDKPRLAVVFMDEVDVLCRTKDEASSRNPVQLRVIAQLLALLDDVSASCPGRATGGHVAIIGATNHPNDIELTLRRAGRFDCEVCSSKSGARGDHLAD